MLSITKYIEVTKINFRNHFIKGLRYRADFFVGLITDFAFNALRILFIYTLFSNIDRIGSWGANEFYLLLAVSFLIEGGYMLFFYNGHTQISRKVLSGEFDFMIVKPINLVFNMSTHSVNFGSGVSNILLGLFMLIRTISLLSIKVTLQGMLISTLSLIFGLVIYFGLSLMINLIAFWVIKTDSIYEIFMNSTDLSRYPGQIFSPKIEYAITYILPMQLISVFPTMYLLGEKNGTIVIQQLFYMVLVLIASSIMIKLALKRYASASS